MIVVVCLKVEQDLNFEKIWRKFWILHNERFYSSSVSPSDKYPAVNIPGARENGAATTWL